MAKRKSNKSNDFDDFAFFPPSRPIKTDDGIKSRSQRGAFAANWWAKRWLAVLESYGIGSRLQRGRSYARSGQVLNIEIEAGKVSAQVQGSRPKPYKVEMRVTPLSPSDWEAVLDLISEQAIYAAQLLDGTMPQDIETLFSNAHISLFPATARDVQTECSCPDYANPCKHIAAVYYLMGEEFDRDPFLIFALRGRNRDAIIQSLRERRSTMLEAEPSEGESLPEPITSHQLELQNFWGSDSADLSLTDYLSHQSSNSLQRLGTPPANTEKSLESLYRNIIHYATEKLLGNDE
jgi:uncharacterized Zn finger protein